MEMDEMDEADEIREMDGIACNEMDMEKYKIYKWMKQLYMMEQMYMNETAGYGWNCMKWMELDEMDGYGWKYCQIPLLLFRPASQHSSNDIPLSLRLSTSPRLV